MTAKPAGRRFKSRAPAARARFETLRRPDAAWGPMVFHRTTSSTNNRAKDVALRGAPDGTLVIAERQSAARGRQGRTWQTTPGSDLALSIVVRPAPDRIETLPLAAGLAVSDAVARATGIECRIKWPNDVLIGGTKVAGVLIEGRPLDGWLVVGIGVNVNTDRKALDSIGVPATSLSATAGVHIERSPLLAEILRSFAVRLRIARQGRIDRLLSEYEPQDALAGTAVEWCQDQRTRTGVARGIDADGALIVETETGVERLHAGDVHLVTDPRRSVDRDSDVTVA